jgi:hypothetical protein
MKLKLTHVEGSRKGSAESFDVPVLTVGRDPSNVLTFDPVKDDRVSSKHAAFSIQGGSLVVTDMGSRNGTFVAGQKISGPTPVPPGTLVQFGENGPMIMVSYEAGAAAPKPVEKKGGGCGVVIVLVLLLLVVGGGVAAFFFLRHKKGGGPRGWDSVAIGSCYEGVSDTHMEKPVVNDTKVEMKQTLLSLTPEKAHLKLETVIAGQTTANEMDVDLKPKVDDKAPKPVEEKDESVTVPAGTYDCHYTKTVIDGTTTENWVTADVPIPVKTVTTTEIMKSTWTLTKVDKK